MKIELPADKPIKDVIRMANTMNAEFMYNPVDNTMHFRLANNELITVSLWHGGKLEDAFNDS